MVALILPSCATPPSSAPPRCATSTPNEALQQTAAAILALESSLSLSAAAAAELIVRPPEARMRQALAVLTTIALAGCSGPSGPPSTDTSSDALPSLERRVEFL